MSRLPPDTKALRREVYAGLLAFVVGFGATLALLEWLIVHFVEPDTRWWEILHALFSILMISVIGGLALAAGVVWTLSWIHHCCGMYRCLFCGRPLKHASVPCDCRRQTQTSEN
jgi:hypothetical protein